MLWRESNQGRLARVEKNTCGYLMAKKEREISHNIGKTLTSKQHYFASDGKSTQIGRQIAYAEVITPRQYQVRNSLASCLIRCDSREAIMIAWRVTQCVA